MPTGCRGGVSPPKGRETRPLQGCSDVAVGRGFTPAANHAIIFPTKARVLYAQNTIRMPREPFSQVTDAKLYRLIPGFARFLPYLYYSHTTFQNNHILPQHDTNSTAASITEAAAFLAHTVALASKENILFIARGGIIVAAKFFRNLLFYPPF